MWTSIRRALGRDGRRVFDAAAGGFPFRAPANVAREFPQFPVIEDHPALLAAVIEASRRLARG